MCCVCGVRCVAFILTRSGVFMLAVLKQISCKMPIFESFCEVSMAALSPCQIASYPSAPTSRTCRYSTMRPAEGESAAMARMLLLAAAAAADELFLLYSSSPLPRLPEEWKSPLLPHPPSHLAKFDADMREVNFLPPPSQLCRAICLRSFCVPTNFLETSCVIFC